MGPAFWAEVEILVTCEQSLDFALSVVASDIKHLVKHSWPLKQKEVVVRLKHQGSFVNAAPLDAIVDLNNSKFFFLKDNPEADMDDKLDFMNPTSITGEP